MTEDCHRETKPAEKATHGMAVLRGGQQRRLWAVIFELRLETRKGLSTAHGWYKSAEPLDQHVRKP